MQTREVNVLHLVEVNHAFVDVFVPCHPGLFLVLELGDHLWAFNRVVFAVHSDEISIEGKCLWLLGEITIISFGVSFDFE